MLRLGQSSTIPLLLLELPVDELPPPRAAWISLYIPKAIRAMMTKRTTMMMAMTSFSWTMVAVGGFGWRFYLKGGWEPEELGGGVLFMMRSGGNFL